MTGRIIASIFLCAFAHSTFAVTSADLEKAIQFPVEKYQLKNGLTVLLSPDTSIPAVSVNTWFRVGSKDEIPGRTGLAHFFEHMMFKGTKRYDKNTFAKFLNGKGAQINAFTSTDYTGYFINLPSENLSLALDIESDRMRNLLLDPKEVTSEREVVKEERRMRYDNVVDGGIDEKMGEIMYKNLPYRWTVIGSMADLNAASMDDLHRFYKTYYSPNNAVLVITGDFEVASTKALIEKYYGSIPREEIQRPPSRPEAAQTAVRRAVIEREAQAPTFAIGYQIPDLNSPDNYPLDLLAIILGQGESSRLYRQMVYKSEVALGVSASSASKVLGGNFTIDVSLKPKSNVEKSILMVEWEVKRLAEAPVTNQELVKARNILMSQYIGGLKTIAGRARSLASNEILYNDYRRVFSDLAEYQKVKVADIQRVASKYLNANQRNIVIVNPKKAGML